MFGTLREDSGAQRRPSSGSVGSAGICKGAGAGSLAAAAGAAGLAEAGPGVDTAGGAARAAVGT